MQGTIAALVLAVALSSQSVAAVNLASGNVLRTGTKIACTLASEIDSSQIEQGSTFEIDATDPSYPQLRGAVIAGYVTHVTQPHGLTRARIAFLLSTIKFANGTSEPIHAYVLGRNVVERNKTAPTAMPPPTSGLAPNASTIAFQAPLGPHPSMHTSTGGYIYANQSGAQIMMRKGEPLTLELAADLQTP